MKRAGNRRLGSLVTVVALLGSLPLLLLGNQAGASGPDVSQSCPLPGTSIDPDTVTGPSAEIPADGQPHPFAVTAAEEEQAAPSNVVTIATVVDVSDPGSTALLPSLQEGAGTGSQHATSALSLVAAPAGRVYVIHWHAVFDSGGHPCSDVQPDHFPFTVRVVPSSPGPTTSTTSVSPTTGPSGSTTTTTVGTFSPGPPASSAPDLVGSSILGNNNFGTSTPTLVKFTFDKQVTGILSNPGGFALIGYQPQNTNKPSGACNVDSDGVSVDCPFTGGTNVASNTEAVANGASVSGNGGNNPLGVVPFASFAASGGATSGSTGGIPNPVLTAAAPQSGSSTNVVFTFSQVLSVTKTQANGFGFDDSNGNEFDCGRSRGCVASTAGNQVTVTFPASASPSPPNGQRFYARGVGDPGAPASPGAGFTAGTVYSSTTNIANATSSAGPSVANRPGLTKVAATSNPSQFLFTVDRASTTGFAGDFLMYNANTGGVTTGTSISAQDNQNYLVGFSAITASNNGSFTFGAITEAGLTGPNAAVVGVGPPSETNSVGGVVVTSNAGSLATYQGPRLLGASGTVANAQATFTFSGPIAAGSAVPADFFVIAPSGATQATGTAAVVNGSNVTVTFGGQSVAGMIGAGVIGCVGPNAAPPGCAGAGTQPAVNGGALATAAPATDTNTPSTAVSPGDVAASAS